MSGKLQDLLENVLEESFDDIKQIDNFKNFEYWDSLMYVGLVTGIQSEFDVTLAKDDIEKVLNYKGIEQVLNKLGVAI